MGYRFSGGAQEEIKAGRGNVEMKGGIKKRWTLGKCHSFIEMGRKKREN